MSDGNNADNRLLALLDFRRKFDQIRAAVQVSNIDEKSAHLKPLIPLFLTAFSNTSPSEIREKFGELANDFAQLCGVVLVREIKNR
jgi:hypothetical protein